MKFKVGDLIYYTDPWRQKDSGIITKIRSRTSPYYIELDDDKGRGYVAEDTLTLRKKHNRNGANEVISLQGANS